MTKYEFYKKMASKCSDKAVNTGDEVYTRCGYDFRITMEDEIQDNETQQSREL